MAEDPKTYFSSGEKANEEAARRNTLGGTEEHITGIEVPDDGPWRWYVTLAPVKCPVRGVTVSSLRKLDWRSTVANVLQDVKEKDAVRNRIAIGAGIALVLLIIAISAGDNGIATFLLLCFVSLALFAYIFTLYSIAVIQKVSKKHLFFKCECGNSIGTDVDWVCGRCGHRHERIQAAIGSFLHKCSRCGDEPDSFVCYHCGRIIPFLDQSDYRHPARAVNITAIVDPDASHRQILAEHDREIERAKKEAERFRTLGEREVERKRYERHISPEFLRSANDRIPDSPSERARLLKEAIASRAKDLAAIEALGLPDDDMADLKEGVMFIYRSKIEALKKPS